MGVLRINYNFQSEFAQVNLLRNERNLNSSIEKLSTGYRINSAKDDAAGLFIADQLNLVANALDQGVRNAQDGISAAQIAETTLAQIYDKLVSIYTKAEQAANDTNAAINRQALQEDIDKLIDAIDRIANTAEFNGRKLLDGTFKNQYIHYGPRADQKLTISIDSATATDLAAYVLKGDGKTVSNTGQGLATLLTNNRDYKFNSASDTVSIQGINIESSLIDNSVVDAAALAKAINSNPDLQKKGIEATAANKSVANAFSTISVGTGGLTIDIYVGPELTTNNKISLTYASGTAVSLPQLIDAINTQAREKGLAIEARDNGSGQLVLETGNGETISIEVSAGAGTTVDLSTLLEGASGSVNNGTGSAVKVGDLTILGAENYGYDFTGITSATTGLGLSQTGTADKYDIKTKAKVDTNENAEFTLRLVNAVIKKVDRQRAALGSIQINLETIIQNNEFSAVQQREAESRIRNVDFAKEMANFTRYQTLMQSGIAMMAQANQLPQMVLQLLR